MDKVSIEQELNDNIVDRWLKEHENDPVDRAALARMKTRIRAKIAAESLREPDAAAPADNDAESVALVISTCGDCPFMDHSGAFTPGGAKSICGHRNAIKTFAASIEGDKRYHWKYRQVDREAAPPAQCPLRLLTTTKEAR